MKTYTIHNFEKGYCNVFPLRRIIPHFTNRIDFVLQFDESVKYIVKHCENQMDWHKAVGIKDLTRLDNSARVGFRWVYPTLQFCLYVHCNGENLGARNPKVIYATRDVEKEIHGYITAEKGLYRLNLEGREETYERGGGSLIKFLMWPYVEGVFVNPKPVKIKLKIL